MVLKKQVCTILYFLLFTCGFQVNSKAQKITDGINISLKYGRSKLLAEVASDLSGHINEFTNEYDDSYDLELSKNVGKHWELGIEIGSSNIKGNTDTPNFTAEGYHYAIPSGMTDPVEYSNKLSSEKILVRYNFLAQSKESKINPFLNIGLGHMSYKALLKYKDSAGGDYIFGKKTGTHKDIKTTTAVYMAGAGIKIRISPNISTIAVANFNAVPYDLLDVVRNYNSAGERIDIFGVYTDLKIGISYSPGNTKKKKTTHPSLPFAPHN